MYSENGVSPLLRKQWITSIEELVTKMWETLSQKNKADNGSQAIRFDLDWDRAFASMIFVGYEPPFNSIHMELNCDISDNGLIEVDIRDYKNWKIYHYDIDHEYSWPKNKALIAEMNSKGFKWHLTEDERKEKGEGLF